MGLTISSRNQDAPADRVRHEYTFFKLHVLRHDLRDFSWLWSTLLADVRRNIFLPYLLRLPGVEASLEGDRGGRARVGSRDECPR
ncbi:expressed unknown protein [Ectocarpus siliculosus]|uniref:Uncharacterized protein n=1 Tax=Ectocarpus siliculosus TaxID=2880 RepID=D7FWK5_ECTSI|nr:expressed unknown protein [Ectocarpus siliculosus]|eukprot:CBJ32093.1 expressed unknown protein [Ectocarpus siliculosus]